jgi:hypothetical protein
MRVGAEPPCSASGAWVRSHWQQATGAVSVPVNRAGRRSMTARRVDSMIRGAGVATRARHKLGT